MDLQLAGQTALIVGAAQGIGRAIAEAFAAEGTGVVLWDRDERVHQVARQLGLAPAAAGRQTVGAEQVDVTDETGVLTAATRLVQDQVQPDHIVYAVGIGSGHYGAPFWRVPVASWPRVWEVNLLGAVRVAGQFAPQMAERRRGTLLMIASVAGQIGSPTDPPYSAAKAGLINFAQCMAQDLAPSGVRVNTICPGMIPTTLNRAVWAAWHASQRPEDQLNYEAWAAAKIARLTPLNRWQSPQDIARLAVFLASPLAENITGQTWNVDGGQVMRA
jgi:NAD(P)-dependent dehydrogenase (short-subunit alcohol dehydrogenase family)